MTRAQGPRFDPALNAAIDLAVAILIEPCPSAVDQRFYRSDLRRLARQIDAHTPLLQRFKKALLELGEEPVVGGAAFASETGTSPVFQVKSCLSELTKMRAIRWERAVPAIMREAGL